jgi:hypothetical protein
LSPKKTRAFRPGKFSGQTDGPELPAHPPFTPSFRAGISEKDKASRGNSDQLYEEGASCAVRKELKIHFIPFVLLLVSFKCFAAPGTATPGQNSSPDNERNFYEVLDDLLKDFELDLKNGEVSGLKDLSLRNIAVSENIPNSFKSHLDLLLTERILKVTKTRMLQCLPCRSKKATLNNNQLVVSSPDSDPNALSRIAKTLGIENFLDVAFSYQASGILLSMYIIDPESGAIVWSKSYNSETSKAAAVRRGVDFSQVDNTRRETEYAPLIQSRFIIYFLSEPNASKTSQCLALGYRMMERYDNRKKEIGFELNYLVDSGTIAGTTAGATQVLYNSFSMNLTLVFLHAWTFIGEEENYNKIRGSLITGLGGTYASGYLSGLVRVGYEWRLAKHYAVSIVLGYRPSATYFLDTTTSTSISGLEYGLGLNIMF